MTEPDDWRTCPRCGGECRVHDHHLSGGAVMRVVMQCSRCGQQQAHIDRELRTLEAAL